MMMKKKKKQSRSQSSTEKILIKTLEPSSDSSPSPRLFSVFRSKLASGKDLKHMFRGIRSKTAPGLSSQSRIVRCPKCHKLLQEPIDATTYKCSACDSILQAKPWELEGNDNSIPEALLSSQYQTEVESPESGRKPPLRITHREYNSRASPSVERAYHSEAVYKRETSDIHREWMRRAVEFSVTGDSDVFASTRSSPYNSRSNASKWTQHEGRYEEPPPFYAVSPSPSSAYEYGNSSPFQGSHVSASEQSYYPHQPNQFKQYGREGWFQESSVASPIRFPGETSDGKYYHWCSQFQNPDLQYLNHYESNSSATPNRSLYSEGSYQAATAPLHSTYSEHSVGISKSETSSEKSSLRDKKKYVRKRNPVVKRYVLPSAGGAPFATCSYCLELLQLPQVSLHGKYKRYQVRCGSCSGVLKFSIREKADTVLDSPSFVDSSTGFADETLTINQDLTSEGHGEISPGDSHLSSSDNDSKDRMYKSTNAAMLSRNLETFEDKGIKEDIRSISERVFDLKLEVLQPQWKPSWNHSLREQQHASSETIGDHLERSEEAHSEKSTKMENNIFERVSCGLEESGCEKNEILKPEEMFGDGSAESLEVPIYKNEGMSDSNMEGETVADRPVTHSVEPLNKNKYVCETCVLSENPRDTHAFDWEETQENEECGGEHKRNDIMGDKTGLHLEKSQHFGDSICDSNSSNGETFEDTLVKEHTQHISNTFSDMMPATPQYVLKSLVNLNQRFLGHPDQSGEATEAISRIHEEQSKYEYHNLRERQEWDMTVSDMVGYELEESRNETNETFAPAKVDDDRSAVSLQKESETFDTIVEGATSEEKMVSHRMGPRNETIENSYGTLEPLFLEGSGYAGERTWAETMGDRAGLHLEEYENYSKPLEWTSERAPTFHMREYELGPILRPEEDVDGRSEFSSRGSLNDHESLQENVGFHNSKDDKPDQSQHEYENFNERQELSNTANLQECRHETNETLEPGKMVGDVSVVSLEKEGETKIGDETGEERSVFDQMEPQNENLENSNGSLEPVNLKGSEYASRRTWAETTGDGAGKQLEESKSNPFEWTSERAATFRIREYDLRTMLEPNEDADGRLESSSRGSFSDHKNSKEREMNCEEKLRLVIGSRTEAIQVGEMAKDMVSFQLEECENESMKLDETFAWTSGRTLTFRQREYELGRMLEPDEDVDGISESSVRGSFIDSGNSKERALIYKNGSWLVDDYETKVLKAGLMSEDGPSLHLENCENEKKELDQTLEPTDDIFRLSLDDTPEKGTMTFHLEMHRNKEENLGQTFKQGEAEEDIPEFASRVSSSEGHESPSKMAEIDNEAEEEIMADQLEHLQKEKEKLGLTSETSAYFYNTTEPFEIVGLRHALYQTQALPLRSPLSSPIHTPIGSPLHYLMGSQMRSPIASPMHSHIVSPLRSPINTSGSLSDVLFFGKKT